MKLNIRTSACWSGYLKHIMMKTYQFTYQIPLPNKCKTGSVSRLDETTWAENQMEKVCDFSDTKKAKWYLKVKV